MIFLLQILQRRGIVANHHLNLLAFLHFGTVAAGGNTFLQTALTDWAKSVAKDCLPAISAATVAVDLFGENLNIVEFRPIFGGLLAKDVVIGLGGDVGVAFFAVKTAESYHLVHNCLFEFLDKDKNNFKTADYFSVLR